MQTLTPEQEHALAVVAMLMDKYHLTREQAVVLVVVAWVLGEPQW